ncbi:hypothetical protein [Cloacibacterium sp. TD35]|uniref:hypothetical protein n=1 Tax=Cloacibacterium sp. TD35 TaxID=2976818 RepID=UPI00237D66B0|nr:hypothetical protein [Cloacibacterium sp. TD35]WDT67281.1 hypothetical protein N7277_08035 [Cloacibacterium sp. TD35]
MIKKITYYYKKCLFLIAFLLYGLALSQTPGLIIRDGAGNIPPQTKSAILDPNKDGYISLTNSGFTTTDLGLASEINYYPLALMYLEPSGDLSRGPNGSFSDLVPDANGRSFYAYSDGTNIYFRLRIGNMSTGSYGYSALIIDADGKFGPEDPNYTSTNPGYEYEVSVQTGFKISVYDVNSGTSCTEVWTRNLATNPQYVQTSLAYTTNTGTPDYFIDFYVPYSSFTGSTTVNANTALRFQPGTVMAPDTALCGPTSDAYPVNNVTQQPQCTPTQIAEGTCSPLPCSAPPTVNSPLAAGATTITGTWTKASYSTATTATIEIFKNNVLLGTTTATSGGSWSYTTTALSTNDLIYAKASTTDATDCYKSNEVRVVGSTCTIATPVSFNCVNGKKLTILNVPANNTITLYKLGTSTPLTTFTPTATSNFAYADGGTISDINCTSGNSTLSNGFYYFTQVDTNGCSFTSAAQGNCSSTTTISITTTTINDNTSTINFTTSASAPTGTNFMLYRNKIPVPNKTITTASAGTSFSFDVSDLTIIAGEIYQVAASGCFSPSAGVTATAVPCNTIPPVINNNNGSIAAGQSISGTSGYIGATVTIRNNTGDTLIGTATVDSNGKWSLTTPVAVAGTSYYSTVTNSCGVSAKSNIVTTLTATSSARCGTITSPVNTTDTTVSGTLATAVASTKVNLYIDGSYIGQATTSTTTWSITVGSNKIYGGGVLSIGIIEGSNAEVICPNTVTATLVCTSPTSPTVTPTSFSVTEGATKSISITNSTSGVLYTLETSTGTDASTSYFGNGGTLTFTSYPIVGTSGTDYKITAINLSSPSCTAQTALTITIQSDTDDDGVAEADDLDDDNDGILDTVEDSIEGTPIYVNDFGTGAPTTDSNVIGHAYDATDPNDGFYAVTTSNSQTAMHTKTDLIGNIDAGNPIISNGSTDGRYLMININSPSFDNLAIYRVTNISTTKGKKYRFRIDLAGLANGLPDVPILKISVKDALNNELASASSTDLGVNDDVWRRLSFDFTATTTTVILEIINQQPSGSSGNDVGIDNIVFTPFNLDVDNDGIPNRLDLDSDGDGCPDAAEGDENVSTSQLVANSIPLPVDANGVPQLVNSGGAADIGSDQGQGKGEAYNAAVQSGCFCYKPAQTTGTALDGKTGITSLGRASTDSNSWPMVRKGAWLVLESKNKGFVINRLTDSQLDQIPESDLREGMIIYNTTIDNLQINIDGTHAGWRTYNTQACPD